MRVDELFFAIASAVEQCMGNFNAQEFASTAWAFATEGQSDAQLFISLARAAETSISNFDA